MAISKIKKFLGLANNLTTTDEGYALDARQGKALNDQIAKHETYRTIATSAANKTYKAQVTELLTAFNGLSKIEKIKSCLHIGDGSLLARFYGGGQYGYIAHASGSPKVTIMSYYFSESPRIDRKVIDGNGACEATTMSDTTDANAVSLIVVD